MSRADKGTSAALPTPAQHAAARKAAQARKRKGGRSGLGQQSGSTLFDDIAADRRERRQSFRERFEERLRSEVTSAMRHHEWSTTTRAQMSAYIKALVYGGGAVPEGLRGQPLEVVRRCFALTFLERGARPGSFAAERLDWFPEAKRQAGNVIVTRRTRAVARHSA